MLGIVNGTTNFILPRMEAGVGYGEALAEAQQLGYAETDPSDDVSGADAAAKMAILATVAFGARVGLEDVLCEGIEQVRPEHVEAVWQEAEGAIVGSSIVKKIEEHIGQPDLVSKVSAFARWLTGGSGGPDAI